MSRAGFGHRTTVRDSRCHSFTPAGCGRTMMPHSESAGSELLRDLRDPAIDELPLLSGDETRRAEVGQDRPLRIEAQRVTQFRTWNQRLHGEELVEAWCARHHDALGRALVQRDRFLPLRVVPDEHAIGNLVHQALVAQVVPAEHQQRGGDLLTTGAPDEISLREPDAHERRHHQQIRTLRRDECLHIRDRSESRFRVSREFCRVVAAPGRSSRAAVPRNGC